MQTRWDSWFDLTGRQNESSIFLAYRRQKWFFGIKFLLLAKGFQSPWLFRYDVYVLLIIFLPEGYLDVDVKDLTTRYTNDVIASCAFGLKVDSHMNENNEFYAMGKIATTFKASALIKFFVVSSFPVLSRVSIFKIMFRRSFTFFPVDGHTVASMANSLNAISAMIRDRIKQIIRHLVWLVTLLSNTHETGTTCKPFVLCP